MRKVCTDATREVSNHSICHMRELFTDPMREVCRGHKMEVCPGHMREFCNDPMRKIVVSHDLTVGL